MQHLTAQAEGLGSPKLKHLIPYDYLGTTRSLGCFKVLVMFIVLTIAAAYVIMMGQPGFLIMINKHL